MKLLATLIILIIFSGCKTYVQVFETKSKNTITENNFYVFENDSLKITYDFWENRGLLKFSVFNKLEKPIYIDWKKSSLIYNDMKINYWTDEEIQKSYSNFYYSSNYYSGFSFGSGSSIQTTTISRDERITFIPPKSTYIKNTFYIVPNRQFMVRDYTLNKSVENEFKKGKMMNILEKEFGESDSPFNFRNFITFSLSEDIKEEFYVDNQFYLSKIQKVLLSDFARPIYDETRKPRVMLKDNKGRTLKYSQFQKSGSFYLRY